MTGDRFARPPVEGDRDELAVYAWSFTAGWDLAVEIGRATIDHERALRVQAEAEVERYRTAEAEWRAEYDAHVRKGRGALPYLDVLHRRAEKHPESYAAEIARTQDHHDRVWSGWQTSTSPITATTDTGRAA